MRIAVFVVFFVLHLCRSTGEGSCSHDPQDATSELIQSLYEAIESADYQLANPAEYPVDYAPHPAEEFDFIVVGAGSAGSAVASRLSEVRNWRVLLIEAGGDPSKTSEIPGLVHFLQGTSLDWAYLTDSEEDNCLGMVNNSCKWPRGKVLGGSSTINGNLYVRGHPRDYDAWEEAGNRGWGFKDVLRYFKKSEKLTAKEVLKNPDFDVYHNTDGVLTVSSYDSPEVKEIVDVYSDGVKELGYKSHSDCNGESQLGFTPLQGTIVNGKRCSTAKAFLSPAKHRKNLKVTKNSLVSKILIDKDSLIAHSVEFINSKGETVIVKATKEIIISAGAINSPQLLMLSGIGPEHHLNEVGVEVIKNLNVGENLQDHMLMTGVLLSFNYSQPIKPPLHHMFEYLLTSSGRLSNIGLLSSAIFIDTEGKDDYPEIQFHIIDIAPNRDEDVEFLAMHCYNIRKEIAQSIIEANKDRFLVFTMPTLLRPKSKGKVLLKSKNPKESPKIISGYLSDEDEDDIRVYTDGIEFVEKLVQTKAFKSFDAKLHRIDIPACRDFDFPSRLYWKCALKHLASTTFHPSCTCKMGPLSDPTAVVDPRLRVRGIKNLRVADASIMPNIISGNTNAPSIMIGERAADLIKEDWS